MGYLNLDQLRSLADLARAHKQVEEANRLQAAAEEHCWEMGISAAQVGAIIKQSRETVSRRWRQRLELLP
jgi:hypothetical protein